MMEGISSFINEWNVWCSQHLTYLYIGLLALTAIIVYEVINLAKEHRDRKEEGL